MKKERPIEEITDNLLLEQNINNPGLISTDPLGSYTGRMFPKWEVPVQDADDL